MKCSARRQLGLFCRFCRHFIAELRRAKCAREAPWVRKIGNPSSRENLVMTSAYERLTNAVRTDSGGGGRSSRGEPHGEGTGDLRNTSAGFVRKKDSFIFVMWTNVRGR